MRRYIPALLLALAAIAPFPLAGCDMLTKLKGGGADAASDAAVAVEVDAAVETPAVAAADAATADATAPLATATTTAIVKKVTDGGITDAATTDAAAVVADAGAMTTDSGAAPAPTPTIKLPRFFGDGGIPHFDAGAFKLPHK